MCRCVNLTLPLPVRWLGLVSHLAMMPGGYVLRLEPHPVVMPGGDMSLWRLESHPVVLGYNRALLWRKHRWVVVFSIGPTWCGGVFCSVQQEDQDESRVFWSMDRRRRVLTLGTLPYILCVALMQVVLVVGIGSQQKPMVYLSFLTF